MKKYFFTISLIAVAIILLSSCAARERCPKVYYDGQATLQQPIK